eukprot:UN33409
MISLERQEWKGMDYLLILTLEIYLICFVRERVAMGFKVFPLRLTEVVEESQADFHLEVCQGMGETVVVCQDFRLGECQAEETEVCQEDFHLVECRVEAVGILEGSGICLEEVLEEGLMV